MAKLSMGNKAGSILIIMKQVIISCLFTCFVYSKQKNNTQNLFLFSYKRQEQKEAMLSFPARSLIILFIFLLVIPLSHAQVFNPKNVDSIALRIVQNGQLEVRGSVDKANLTLYIPQEGIQDLKVTSNQFVDWRYETDNFGNKVVTLGWITPSGIVTYRLETIVKSSAKFVDPKSDIGSDARYLNATNSIVLTDDIRQLAYPYEKTWNNVARLTEFVYDYVDYDLSLVGARKSSDWVYKNKRGVCVEHANLLAALLRASGIPTRYIVGYAYSQIEKRLIGHTWVEVLASDGTWVPFDPTWLEGGYLDATHIKTANLLDDNQVDVLTYTCSRFEASCNIVWKRGDSLSSGITGNLYADTVDILDYKLKNITAIVLSAPNVPLGGYGYIRAIVNSTACVINQIEAQPCVDERRRDVLEIIDKERKFFSCGTQIVYWFYKEQDGRRPYTCPVVVFDQIGSSQDIDVKAVRGPITENVAISGPETAAINERFVLTATAPSDFVFYSPDFGRHTAKEWTLSASRPGDYVFYLYGEGSLAKKTVRIVEKKEFNLMLEAPSSVKKGNLFLVNITVKNLDTAKTAKLAVDFDGQETEDILSFLANEQKFITKNLTALNVGPNQITVSVYGDTLTPYSTFVFVEDDNQTTASGGWFERILDFFEAIGRFFSSLLGQK